MSDDRQVRRHRHGDFNLKFNLKELFNMKNFCGLMEVLCALHCASVSRLESTWQVITEFSIEFRRVFCEFSASFPSNFHRVFREFSSEQLVPKSSMEKFKQLTELMDPKKSFKNYRKCVEECFSSNHFYLPFLGVALSDFTFFDEGNR